MFNKLMGGPSEVQEPSAPSTAGASAAKPHAPAANGASAASPTAGPLKRVAASATSTTTSVPANGTSIATNPRTLIAINPNAPTSVAHAPRPPVCPNGLDGDDVSKILIDLPIKYGNFAVDFIDNGVKLESAIKLSLTLYKRELGKSGIFESLEADGNQEKKTDDRDVVYSTIIEAAEQIINSIATRHFKETGRVGTQSTPPSAVSTPSSSDYMGTLLPTANGQNHGAYDVFSQPFDGLSSTSHHLQQQQHQQPTSTATYYGGGHDVAANLTFGDGSQQHGYPGEDDLAGT